MESEKNFLFIFMHRGRGQTYSQGSETGGQSQDPKVPLDILTEFFERLRKVINERGLFYVRKQREHETFENFYAELTTVVGRCG